MAPMKLLEARYSDTDVTDLKISESVLPGLPSGRFQRCLVSETEPVSGGFDTGEAVIGSASRLSVLEGLWETFTA